MGQLKDLKNSMDPAEILFVADAMTGQEAVNVAQSFHEQIGVTGIALTKMDGDARGGAALSIKAITGLSVKVVSVGEKPSDLEPFYPDRVASRILDMGDVLSLVEKAQESISEEDALATAEKLKKNAFDIEDFQKQLHMMNKMGSLESILKMMPGAQGMLSKMGDLSMAEKEMKKIDAIICSMTREEKSNHKILNGSRRKRIAQGSGTQVQDVNRFIQQFNQMNKMMSKVQKMGLGGLMKGLGKGGMPKFPF
jgi:signal recognition particle subunit SRP54